MKQYITIVLLTRVNSCTTWLKKEILLLRITQCKEGITSSKNKTVYKVRPCKIKTINELPLVRTRQCTTRIQK